jgi:RNA polymerase sigma-70 factor (ECF subfamily)
MQMDLSAEVETNEHLLVQRVREGDDSAWEKLVQAHQQPVFRLSYLLLGDAADAEDNAQETLLRAWRALDRFDNSRSLRPWLLSIAANLACNCRRSIGRYFGAMLLLWLSEPAAVKPETQMPDIELSVDRFSVARQPGVSSVR